MENLATKLIVKITDAKTKTDLENVRLEIIAKKHLLNDDWLGWLRIHYNSKMDAITYVFTDEHLNKEGKKYGIPENKDN